MAEACDHNNMEFREESGGMQWFECRLCHTWVGQLEDMGAGR